MPSNPPVHLLNIFSLETVLPLISLPIWGQRCSFIHNWHFCPCPGGQEAEEALEGCTFAYISAPLWPESSVQFISLTLYELTICFIIGMVSCTF